MYKEDIVCHVISCPTKPDVPIPPPAGLFSILHTNVAIGPNIALATIGGIQIIGFLIIFGTWSIDVPNPWAKSPFHLFALKLITAKPTIWAAHPTVEAPAAIPDRPSIIDNAAELIGNVNIIPIITETAIPIKKWL